jgi:hypothetical protein
MDPYLEDDIVLTHDFHESETLWYSSLFWFWDKISGPTIGVCIAISSILIVQYRSSLADLFYNAMEDGWQQTVLECVLGLREMARAYYQMVCEIIRSIRQSQNPQPVQDTVRSQISLLGGVPPPLVIKPTDEPRYKTGNTKRVNNLLPTRNDARDEERSLTMSTNSTHSLSFRQKIEPAFLDEQDYPPGWLVYHPRLGVVPKIQADKFEGANPTQQHTPIFAA